MKVKQVIIIRKDLNMRRGKEISQGAHSSCYFLIDKFQKKNFDLSEEEREWICDKFTKICLQVSSEKELLEIHEKAKSEGLTSFLVQDAGLTEFGGIPTFTCVAIGPHFSEKIDAITGHLKLY